MTTWRKLLCKMLGHRWGYNHGSFGAIALPIRPPWRTTCKRCGKWNPEPEPKRPWKQR